MHLGEFIKIRKKELNVSTDDIAAKLGVHRSNVFRWERCETDKIDVKIVHPLSEILHCDPLDIFLLVNPDYVPKNDTVMEFKTTTHERRVITSYRTKPDMQPAVDKLLDISNL